MALDTSLTPLFRWEAPQESARERTVREGLEEAAKPLGGVGLARALVAYRTDPVGFLVDVLGIPEHTIRWSSNPGYESHAWDGTPDPLVAALDALAAGEDVGVESGTGTGKTYTLGAGVMLWFLACWENAIVITVAPKEDQLKLNLWKEAGKLWPRFKDRFPTAELTSLKLRMRGGTEESWAATGFVAGVGADEESANKARGFHAAHMLVIFEEMPGVDAAITTAFENTSTGSHNLRLGLGNPDHQQDELHKFCTSPGVRHVRISALDHPNLVTGEPDLIPGACSPASVERRAVKYGRGSRLYDAMVRGLSPKESAEALIRWEWLEQAAARYRDEERRRTLTQGLPALGVDVANSENGDKAALSRWQGAVCPEVVDFPCPNASTLGEQVAVEMRAGGVDEFHVGVDSVGVGASTVNKLKELGRFVRALNGGASPDPALTDTARGDEEELFNNLRSQMYWQAREDLQHGRIAVVYDESLFQDLTAPKWTTRNGKIVVESKEDFVKRLGRSPNKGDAFVYGNWVRKRAAEPAPKTFPTDEEKRTSRIQDALARAAKRAAAEGEMDEAPVELAGEGWEGLYN